MNRSSLACQKISDIVRKTRRTNRQNVSGEEEVRVVLGFSINAIVLLLRRTRQKAHLGSKKGLQIYLMTYFWEEGYTGCPVTDGGTLSLIENLQFWPKKVPKANTNPKHDSI